MVSIDDLDSPFMSNEALVVAYRNGDASAWESLLLDNKGLVLKAVAKTYNRDISIDKDDLIQEGYIGMMKAIDGFNLDSTASFSTYAYKCMWGHLYRYVHGRDYRQGYQDISFLSIDSPVKGCEGGTIGDMVTFEDDSYNDVDDRVSGEADIANALSLLNQFTSLDSRTVAVIKLRYGIEAGPYTLDTIGDMYGITGERVRQIEQKALRSIRNSSWGRARIREKNEAAKEKSYALGQTTSEFLTQLDREMKYSKEIKGTGLSLDADLLASIYR